MRNVRVFIYEFTCATATAEGSSLSGLQTEGRAMLLALLEDFGRLPAASILTLLASETGKGQTGKEDRHLSPERPDLIGGKRLVVADHHRPGKCFTEQVPGPFSPAEEKAVFLQLAGRADYTLVIAPEGDDILLRRCLWVEEAGGRLLGPSPAAVRLAGDKLALGRHLGQRGIPTPDCVLVRPGMPAPTLPCAALGEGRVRAPAVCKPRYGAGSQATLLIRDPDELPECLATAPTEGVEQEFLLQPFVPGRPASAAFLIGPRALIPLPAAAQTLSNDGRFHYLGGVLPLEPSLAHRAVRLGLRAVQAIEGLQGYVGVDVVLGDAADGSRDWLIEINPRLTTSYIGLRALCQTNLASAMLNVVCGEAAPALSWRPGTVRFQADGAVDYLT